MALKRVADTMKRGLLHKFCLILRYYDFSEFMLIVTIIAMDYAVTCAKGGNKT